MSEHSQSSSEQGAAGPNVQGAVAVAAQYLRSLLGEVGGLRLEEVEDRAFGWLVTFSFVPSLTDRDLPFLTKREYKQVEINGSGQPVAMRIRKIE